MTSNRFNDQVDVARQVRGMCSLPVLQEQVQVFRNWIAEWDKADKPLRTEHWQLIRQRAEGGAVDSGRIEELENVLRQRPDSPWDLLRRTVPDRSADPYITSKVRLFLPPEQVPELDIPHTFCLRCVRLSILRDKGLPGDLPRLTKGVLDREDVDGVWDYICADWLTWGPALGHDLEEVQADLADQTKENGAGPSVSTVADPSQWLRSLATDIDEVLNAYNHLDKQDMDAQRLAPNTEWPVPNEMITGRAELRSACTQFLTHFQDIKLLECDEVKPIRQAVHDAEATAKEMLSHLDSLKRGWDAVPDDATAGPTVSARCVLVHRELGSMSQDGLASRLMDDKEAILGRLTGLQSARAVQGNQMDQGDGGTVSKVTKPPKEPSKIAAQAYLLYTSMGITQADVARELTRRCNRRRPYTQGEVSRMVTQVREWRKDVGLSVDTPGEKPNMITQDPAVTDLGSRTDGHLTGDPRYRDSTQDAEQ